MDYILQENNVLWDRMVGGREICFKYDEGNATLAELEHFTVQCTNRNWKLQELSASQITFKKDPTDTENPSKKTKLKNESAAGGGAPAASPADDGTRVQEFLVFAVVLPMHPPSFDMMRALSVVGPLFPEISFVMGNGYHFEELVAKYNVRSFPRLLFFRKGKFKQVYRGDVSVRALATQLTLWGRQLPAARPYYPAYAGGGWVAQPHPDYAALDTPDAPDAHLHHWRAAGLPQSQVHSWLRKCDPWRLEALWKQLPRGQGLWPGVLALLSETARCEVDAVTVARLMWYRVPGNGPAVEPAIGFVNRHFSSQLEQLLYAFAAVYALLRALQMLAAELKRTGGVGVDILDDRRVF